MDRFDLLPFGRWWHRVRSRTAPSPGHPVSAGSPAISGQARSLDRKLHRSRHREAQRIAYDCVEWHTAVDYPEELPREAAAIHIGMFLGWCIEHGLAGRFHVCENGSALESVRSGVSSPARFVLDHCEGIFWEEDLDDEGNAFAKQYYLGELGYGEFLRDYERVLARDLPSLYHVADTPANRALLSEVIDQRYATWSLERIRPLLVSPR